MRSYLAPKYDVADPIICPKCKSPYWNKPRQKFGNDSATCHVIKERPQVSMSLLDKAEGEADNEIEMSGDSKSDIIKKETDNTH